METTQDLKARILRITAVFAPSAHNKAIINAACKELFTRTGEVCVNGAFVKVA